MLRLNKCVYLYGINIDGGTDERKIEEEDDVIDTSRTKNDTVDANACNNQTKSIDGLIRMLLNGYYASEFPRFNQNKTYRTMQKEKKRGRGRERKKNHMRKYHQNNSTSDNLQSRLIKKIEEIVVLIDIVS